MAKVPYFSTNIIHLKLAKMIHIPEDNFFTCLGDSSFLRWPSWPSWPVIPGI